MANHVALFCFKATPVSMRRSVVARIVLVDPMNLEKGGR